MIGSSGFDSRVRVYILRLIFPHFNKSEDRTWEQWEKEVCSQLLGGSGKEEDKGNKGETG